MDQQNKPDRLLHHNYDGIQEYDNSLPRWWVWLFILTIIWGGVYALWFHASGRPTPHEQLAAEMSEIKKVQASHSSAHAGPDTPTDETMYVLAKDATVIAKGSAIFSAKCAVCHGPEGQGLIGPNLTDANWIHGGTPSKIRTTVEEGVRAKGMLAWKTMLSHDEITNVVAFVLSIRGSNPPNPKKPEGDLLAQ